MMPDANKPLTRTHRNLEIELKISTISSKLNPNCIIRARNQLYFASRGLKQTANTSNQGNKAKNQRYFHQTSRNCNNRAKN